MFLGAYFISLCCCIANHHIVSILKTNILNFCGSEVWVLVGRFPLQDLKSLKSSCSWEPRLRAFHVHWWLWEFSSWKLCNLTPYPGYQSGAMLFLEATSHMAICTVWYCALIRLAGESLALNVSHFLQGPIRLLEG